MGKVTVYCVISGCTPEIASNILTQYDSYGPIVTSALKALADPHEVDSQNDLSVIAPLHSSGKPYDKACPVSQLVPERDLYVIPHCVMGRYWDFGSVEGPTPNEPGRNSLYLVSFGSALMVQTYALDILALATHGRMTALRLWRLAMLHGFEAAGREYQLDGVDYGDFMPHCQQFPIEFPGLDTFDELVDLEDIENFEGVKERVLAYLEGTGDAEGVKEQLVHMGLFWVWMAPDRFPIPSMNTEYPSSIPAQIELDGNRSVIESLPLDVLIPIISLLPLESLLNLAGASRSLRTGILGSDHLACLWIYRNAPWWIPVPTQTPKSGNTLTSSLPTYPASQWSPHIQTHVNFPTGLNWAYVRECARSGSMLNRRRIWQTALEIEDLADAEEV